MPERQESNRPERRESNRSQSQSDAARSSAERLRERGRQVERDAQSFAANLEGLASDVEQLVRTRLEAQPYRTLALAAGAGFVVGGGVTMGVLATMARVATRMATAAILQTTLAHVFSGFQSETPDQRSQP